MNFELQAIFSPCQPTRSLLHWLPHLVNCISWPLLFNAHCIDLFATLKGGLPCSFVALLGSS